MLLGFISLFLAVTQDYIAKICIPTDLANKMLPCRNKDHKDEGSATNNESCSADVCVCVSNKRDLSKYINGAFNNSLRWYLQGKVSLITKDGIHQLHIFIFVLAVMQIVYAILTMGLGRAKVKNALF